MAIFPDTEVINQIICGHCADPFSLLGMHQVDTGLLVRALLPDATHVWVVDTQHQRQVSQLDCCDARGFFAGIIPRRKKPFRYQLQVSWHGQQQRIEDPYRFGLLLAHMDSGLLAQGTHLRSFEHSGAHLTRLDAIDGVRFAVWAPGARRVSVVGEFNFWDARRHPMRLHHESGVWELFLPDVKMGQRYKYEIIDSAGNIFLKADPYAFAAEMRPQTASIIYPLAPKTVMTPARQQANALTAPIAIYEVHLGSWRRHAHNNSWLHYRELAEQLVTYVKEMGFTHIEFLPVSEHPFDGSWGYQPLGLYAPTSRFGSPQDFRFLINQAHDAGINVILDWVPGHFPGDEHGLARFDGTALYEHADPREGHHPDWNTLIYNYGRPEVRNYLAGNALYWLEQFGIDGLRTDAVSSMIYRDYSRPAGQWIPNYYGGRDNLEAIDFLRHTHRIVGMTYPGMMTVAEESTDYPGVTRPPDTGGLGFNYKWNMGWMHDTLKYLQHDPVHRKWHHNLMTFGMLYAYRENFILPLSHDEVVHGKGSLLARMPGDSWHKFACLRAYYGFMWAHPGKKLLFMGNEFAQEREWNADSGLDWHLLDAGGCHSGVQKLVRDLNHCYQQQPALYQQDYQPAGFEWLVVDDADNSVFAFLRRDNDGNALIAISNFTPMPRYGYRIGIPQPGHYRELLNTDSSHYCGSNRGNQHGINSQTISSHQHPYSLSLTLPPLATLYLLRK